MSDALHLSVFNRSGPTSAVGSPTNVTFDDSGDGLAYIFQPHNADAITHLGIRYGVRTGTPPTYVASLQSVTAAGIPDGTALGGGTPASSTFTPPADTTLDGTWYWEQLDNAYTPSRGDFLAACWEYSSGTINASNCSSFSRGLANLKTALGFPYACLKTGGTWAKQGSPIIAFGYRTASGRYGYLGTGSFATNISTSGHRSAMHFTLPAGWGDTYELQGAHLAVKYPNTGNAPIFGLWNEAGTLLASKTLDSDHSANTGSDTASELFFDAAVTLSFGTKYYVGLESNSTSTVGVRGVQLAEAADRSAFPNGVNRGFSSWNGSAWTDDNTVMPLVELIHDDITEPAGGGGGGLIIGG